MKHTKKAPRRHGKPRKAPRKHVTSHKKAASGHQKHQPPPKHAAGHPGHKPARAKLASGSGPSPHGYATDVLDARDHAYSATLTVPSFVDLAKHPAMPPVWDQGDLGSCVPHGALAVAMYAAGVGGVRLPPASPLGIYRAACEREGTTTDDDPGTMVRNAVKACATNRLEYLSVERDASALQSCLSEGFPVVLGVTLLDSFDGGVLGGHCLVAVGIGYGREWMADGQFMGADPLRRYVKLRNSWGSGEHESGHILLPASYLRRWGADFWTMRSA